MVTCSEESLGGQPMGALGEGDIVVGHSTWGGGGFKEVRFGKGANKQIHTGHPCKQPTGR